MSQPQDNVPKSEKKRIVVVLGMHRSGTSLLTSLLASLGVDLGGKLIPGDENNEAGYWEQLEINRVQDELLNHFRKSWQGPAWMNPYPLDWSLLATDTRSKAKQELTAIVRDELAKAKGLWGFKDPRTTRLLPIWKEIFAELNLEPIYILALRHPADVAASVVKRDKVAVAHGEMLWLLHNLDAVREAGSQIKLVFSYDRWFSHPLEQARRVVQALNLAPGFNEDEMLAAVRAKIRPELRHCRTDRAVSVPFVAEIYQMLEEAGETGRLLGDFHKVDTAVQDAFAKGETWTVPGDAQAENAKRAGESSQAESPARLVAFYLPQFHPIEENDRWWGKGFTEWTNVAQQSPRFVGHYQPQIPGELGFYDLRLAETKIAQANLAREHGIEAFCYWHYWFNGRQVLQRPFEETLASGMPDFGFCLAWANENWTRRWDGQESEILLEQTYGGEADDRAHFANLLPAFRDKRAFRIDGKPVFLIYRPAKLPDARRTLDLWRRLAKEAGLPGLHLIAVVTCFDAGGPSTAQMGFDAELPFAPNFSDEMMEAATVVGNDRVIPYAEAWPLMSRMAERKSESETFPCVTPAWDNSARRKKDAFIIHHSTPTEYGRWLRQEISRVQGREPQHRVVFINAWNEWAEGNHLEPDLKWGRAYLEETRRARAGVPAITESSTTLLDTPTKGDGKFIEIAGTAAEPTPELVAEEAPVAVKTLPGPKLLEMFPVRNRAEFEQVYRNRLGKALDSQKRIVPTEPAPFNLPGHCVVCGGLREFLTDFANAVPGANGRLQPSWREGQVCACKLTSRKRATFHVVAEGLGLTPESRIYCAEQESEFYRRLKARFPRTVGSDFLGPKIPLGQMDYRAVRNEDVTRLTFRDGSLDAVVCLEVLNCVADYRRALAEMARCLKPGGALVLTAPFHLKQDKTVSQPGDAEGTRNCHDFGWDLLDEMRQAGFAEASLNFFTSEDYGYLGAQCVLIARRDAVKEISSPVPVSSIETPPAVSVIIPVFNKIELTIKCLEALKKHTLPDLCEVIVWDNASTDGTQAFFQQPCAANAGVRYIRSEENLGFVGGNNAAAQHARARYLALLNNDTEPQQYWLEALVRTADEDATIGAVGAKLIYPNGDLQEAGGIVFRDASGWNYGRLANPRDPRYNFPREVDYCSAACLLVRTALFRELGGFDVRYAPAYYEDTDLCFALRQAGHKVVYQPRAQIIHHEGATAGQDVNKGFKKHQVVNKQKFFSKWEKVLAHQAIPSPEVVRRASDRARGQRILVVDPMMPMHDRASGSKRLFEMLRLLAAAGHAVTFIARNGSNGARYAAELEEFGIEVYAGDPDRMKELGYDFPAWPVDLRRLLQETKYDTIILSFWYIAEQYLPRIRAWSPTSRVLIDTVDVHFVRERRQGELYKDKKLIAQAGETQRRELKVYSLADGLITVTEDDKKVLEKELPHSRVFIVPNIHELSAEVPSDANRKGLLFVGGFAHLPNEDAVLYFHKEIWPLVQAKVPGIRWTIVGNNPPASVRALHGGLIEVTGYVPSMEPYLESHLISIAPLRYGAGMKGKIGEALAHGLPVVTTSIGAEGMSLQSGDGGMLVASDPETFANHIARLNTDRALWREQSEKGRQHTAAHYTPQRIGERLGNLLEWSAAFTSIIILARNQINDTRQCLDSIEKYTRLPHELILVDNNSTDGTTDFFRQYAATRANVRVVLNRANLGFAGGNNQALSLARGDTILLLNNDTVVTAGWLERMVSALERHPDTGLVGPVSNNISGPQRVKTDYTTFTELPAFAKKWGEAHTGETTEAARLVGFCLMLRRSALEKLGGLDTRYGAGNFEDDDFCIRANLAGFKMRVVWDSFVHHTGGQTFKSEKVDYNASLARNWSIFKSKWAMPMDAALEQGYRMPESVPPGVSIYFPLPNIATTHSVLMEGRCWADGQIAAKLAGPGQTVRKAAAKIELPKVALVGHLQGAKEKLRQRKFAQAWEETVAALKLRPFHPEAYLTLAEIAQAAGDGASALRCAKRAREMAPNWKPAQKFLNGSLRGTARQPWMVTPEIPAAPRLTICMIVKNEEEFLGRCLASVKGLAHQIVVVDTGSTDRTVEIARESGAEVHHFDWCDDFAAARNAGLAHATGDWILSLDADEELMPGEAEQLQKEMANEAVMGFRIPIIDVGQEEDGCHYVPRLFRNAPGLFFLGRLHEQAFSSVEARCKEWGLRHDLGHTRLLHHGYAKEVVNRRSKVERNLRLLEKAMAELPDEPNLVMNLGLELIHAGQRDEGVRRYWEAVELLGAKPDEEIVPELRETMLGQLTSHLIQAKDFAGVLKLWDTPLAKRGEMTASHHFGLGLALLETKRPQEAAPHFSQCLAKRGQAAMSFINRDILKAGPYHCLALSLWGAQDKEGAAQAFLAATREDPASRPVKYDFARLEADRGRELEALKILNDLVQENTADAAVWEFGGRVALSRVEFLSFACDWTAESVKAFPENSSIVRQRAEALFMAQDFAGALPLWLKAGAQTSARGMAAVVMCELMAGDCERQFSTMDEALVCQEMLKWYRRLIACGADSAVLQLHERMEAARKIVPSFVKTWELASQRARQAVPA